MSTPDDSAKIWGGRFTRATEQLMEEFSYSIRFDKKLFEADIRVNQAWAEALGGVGIYTDKEAARVIDALEQIKAEYNAGTLAFSSSDEDIHSANERWLTERLGELGARIHTGRSRNDQVATDVRLYLRDELTALMQACRELQETLLGAAKDNIETVMPGYTHVRQAQPVSFAHYLLSLFFQIQRDCDRLVQARQRCNHMPLGSGALAGAAFAIDRQKLAERLGFDAPTDNSIDATSDRDFVAEALQICSQIMLHLSRVAEDFILWSAENNQFIEIDQAYSTGSSMMPQKRNPDSLELIRGKTARVIGNETTLLVLMKGVPHAYARDLQEDKEPLFDSVEQTGYAIRILSGVIRTLKVNKEKMRAALDPSLYATDVADYLVKKCVPFRQAHSIVGHIVTFAEDQNKSLPDLELPDFQQFSDLFDADLFDLFDPMSSLAKRNLYGGTGPDSINQQLKTAHKLLNS